MGKLETASWPVLVISDQIKEKNDQGLWLREILSDLTEEQHCSILPSCGLGDAHDIIRSREDLGTIVIDWDLSEMGYLHEKNEYLKDRVKGTRSALVLINFIRRRNKNIPIILLTGRISIESIPDEVLEKINEIVWKLTDTPSFLAGRIARQVKDYTAAVLPPFFNELVQYVEAYKYAWHTPGHMGGQGFLTSPSGTALHKFFGENFLRADLSISVPELGSLLDHSGVTGDAENFSAKVFGSDLTYYVLNGTSTANQIIWRSQVSPEEQTLMDRNCHKSLNYSMIITGANPEYMHPLRNGLGIIGPVDFSAISSDKSYKMAVLTNSTYDGICYNTHYVQECLKNVEILHFDEAWYAYAKFHEIYKKHYGMSLPHRNKLVFCSQSTHKLLTAFSQASMIHVRLPKYISNSTEARENFHDLFNESYMMHGSTSPQYSMVASLEVATKMMMDNGAVVFEDIIKEAIELRRKITWAQEDLAKQKDWFFKIWQPPCVTERCENHRPKIPIKELAKNQTYWTIKPARPDETTWHGFAVKDEYAMLDPIKLTFICPGIDINGNMDDIGIPAAIVTNYLTNKGIVCEKTDYYSWLLLNSAGTTRGKQGTLVAELFKFKKLYDSNASLADLFPDLVARYPEKYQDKSLKNHCHEMHDYIKKNKLLEKMREAFEARPVHDLTPAEAYRCIIKQEVESVELRDIKPNATTPRIAGVMLVPYPPGIPIMMGGEKFDLNARDILNYLIARQDFENEFPGYESDIHGIERTAPDENGNKYFKTLLIKTPK
ncbi:MAG TPA: Orn/Lys/Arg decarboxylase N-terminal domain-containing protein [Methanosarcina sp.]